MICMICIMSDSDNDSDNDNDDEYGDYAVKYYYYFKKRGLAHLIHHVKYFDDKNDAIDYAINYVENDIPEGCKLTNIQVDEYFEGDGTSYKSHWDTILREGDDLWELIIENKQQKDEIKQLKLQLEKQTLSNVLDKKIPLGTKSDINEILNSVGYTE